MTFSFFFKINNALKYLCDCRFVVISYVLNVALIKKNMMR